MCLRLQYIILAHLKIFLIGHYEIATNGYKCDYNTICVFVKQTQTEYRTNQFIVTQS